MWKDSFTFRCRSDNDLNYLRALILGSGEDYLRFRDMLRKAVGVAQSPVDSWHKVFDDSETIMWKRGGGDVQLFAVVRPDSNMWEVNLVLDERVVGATVVYGKQAAISRIAVLKEEIDSALKMIGK